MLKRIIALAVSLLLLAALIHSVGTRAVFDALANARLMWFAVASILFIPQTLVIAWRWSVIARPVARIHWREAGRQVLAAGCLNLVLPAKLGDLAKGIFLYRRGACDLSTGLNVVVFEKLLDLAALSAWMLIGWLFVLRTDPWLLAVLALGATVTATVWLLYFTPAGPHLVSTLLPAEQSATGRLAKVTRLIQSAPRVARLIRTTGTRRRTLLAASLLIWLLHLLQIHCFFKAAGADLGILRVIAEAPAAIFAGLLPFTIAGIGLRDWAIVAIFQSPTITRDTLVTAGLLISLRYIVPALAGLLFAPRYYGMAHDKSLSKE